MENKQNYLYGRNAVIEALLTGKPVEKIFIAFGTAGDNINRILSLARKNHIALSTVDKRKFGFIEKDNGIAQGKSQGVIAMLRQFDLISIDDLIDSAFSNNPLPVVVVLDEIEDPQNLGAIARTAECAGASGIIVTEKNSSPITPVAIKASAGALGILPVSKVSSLVQTLDKLKEYGFWIIGTDIGGDKNYYDKIYDRPVCIVIGSEGKGMRPATRKHCDIIVSIPLFGQIKSLNASVSAAIVLYESVRQRKELS